MAFMAIGNLTQILHEILNIGFGLLSTFNANRIYFTLCRIAVEVLYESDVSKFICTHQTIHFIRSVDKAALKLRMSYASRYQFIHLATSSKAFIPGHPVYTVYFLI